jgi:hypothetical protein
MLGDCPVFGSGGVRAARVCLWLVTAICILLSTPAQTRTLHARLLWSPSTDTRVEGYYVYVREATKPYGAPMDAGAARPAGGGTLDWVVTGLSSDTTYFMAVSGYTSDGLESALSNELVLGSPDPCVQDTCTSPTQCTVRALPDGTVCGPAGAAGCGSTCLAGTCLGLADHQASVDRLKLKRSNTQLKVLVKSHFATSTLFAPQTSGLELTLADDGRAAVLDATLGAADLTASGNVIKLVRRRGKTAPVQVRRLVIRVKGDVTFVKAQIVATPPPATLPAGATLVLSSGSICLAGPPPTCQARAKTVTCR